MLHVCSTNPTVDGRNPAPPKKPWKTVVCWYLHWNHSFGFLGGAKWISQPSTVPGFPMLKLEEPLAFPQLVRVKAEHRTG